MIIDEKEKIPLTPDEEIQLAEFKQHISEIICKNLTTTFTKADIDKTTLDIVSYLNEVEYKWAEK